MPHTASQRVVSGFDRTGTAEVTIASVAGPTARPGHEEMSGGFEVQHRNPTLGTYYPASRTVE